MRPGLRLFLHVPGAAGLFGSLGVVSLLSLVGGSHPHQAAPAAATLAATLLVAVPAWALMLIFGAWTQAKEGLPGSLAWLTLGSGVAQAGIAVLAAISALAYSWLRRPTGRWQPRALALVSGGYLIPLAVACWAMSAKAPS